LLRYKLLAVFSFIKPKDRGKSFSFSKTRKDPSVGAVTDRPARKRFLQQVRVLLNARAFLLWFRSSGATAQQAAKASTITTTKSKVHLKANLHPLLLLFSHSCASCNTKPTNETRSFDSS